MPIDRQTLYGEGMYWNGKEIELYSKEELIDIIYKLESSLRRNREEHSRQLGVLTGQ